MESPLVVNATLILPHLKHKILFKAFDKLQVGESFIFHNDRDSKSLYHLLKSQRGNRFEWNYLESGPKNWDINIKRTS
jgi:regulator of cell morphogenesis and NO signaling